MSPLPRLAADAVPKADSAQRKLVIWRGDELAADGGERDVGQVLGEAGVGSVPAGQLDDVGIDLLHVDDVGVRGQIQRARFAAAEDEYAQRKLLSCREIHRISDDVGDTADSGRFDEVAVGRHQHGHRAKA